MTLTPFMILILAGFAVFMGVLGAVSVWSKGGGRKAAAAQPALRSKPEERQASIS
jgi:hypothetical protein